MGEQFWQNREPRASLGHQSPIIVEMVFKFYDNRIGRVIRRKKFREVYNTDT